MVYERKIDVEAERQRLAKELEAIKKELESSQRQLGDVEFLSKAPSQVVEGRRKRAQELIVLREKIRKGLDDLPDKK